MPQKLQHLHLCCLLVAVQRMWPRESENTSSELLVMGSFADEGVVIGLSRLTTHTTLPSGTTMYNFLLKFVGVTKPSVKSPIAEMSVSFWERVALYASADHPLKSFIGGGCTPICRDGRTNRFYSSISINRWLWLASHLYKSICSGCPWFVGADGYPTISTNRFPKFSKSVMKN